MGRYLPEAWPLPSPDGLNRDYFSAGRLLVQQCTACGAVQHPPEEVCFRCQSFRFHNVESAGLGHVYSYIVAHYAVSPLLKESVPYGIALVQLDDYPDVRIVGNVLNLPPEALRIGLPVRVIFEAAADEETGDHLLVPQWEAVE